MKTLTDGGHVRSTNHQNAPLAQVDAEVSSALDVVLVGAVQVSRPGHVHRHGRRDGLQNTKAEKKTNKTLQVR